MSQIKITGMSDAYKHELNKWIEFKPYLNDCEYFNQPDRARYRQIEKYPMTVSTQRSLMIAQIPSWIPSPEERWTGFPFKIKPPFFY